MKRNVLMGILLVIALSSVACGNSVKQTESNGIENVITTWQEQYDLGMKYLEDGDYEQAIVAFTTAIEIDPKQTVVYVGRAQAYIESGETEENLSAALADYDNALALDDMNPDIYLGIADVYIRQGDYENVKEILNQALGKLGENEAISEKLNELENGDIKDSDGKTHRRRGFDENGNLLWYHDLFYGTDGMESKVIAYTADGVETGQVECFYNGSQEQGYDYSLGTGELTMWRQEYDERGNVILTVYENIAFAMHVTNIGRKQIKERVGYMLELVHLEDKANVYPEFLSGGEQQRVAVARALAHAPKLVIADEPTGNIDPELSLEMMELLERVSEMGITVLVVTHEHELVHRFHQRVVTLKEGRIISDVPADKKEVLV